jgi:hypothetical protein
MSAIEAKIYKCSKCDSIVARAPLPYGDYSDEWYHVPGWENLCHGAKPVQIYPKPYEPRHARIEMTHEQIDASRIADGLPPLYREWRAGDPCGSCKSRNTVLVWDGKFNWGECKDCGASDNDAG